MFANYRAAHFFVGVSACAWLGLLGCTGSTGGPPAQGGPVGTGGTVGAGGTAGVEGGALAGVVGPSAGRRLTKQEYLHTVKDLLGVDLGGPDDAGLLPADQPPTGAGFRNDIDGLLPTAVRTDAYESLAARASERVAWAGGLAAHAACTDPTLACREGFVRGLGRLLYRRPLTDSNVQNLLPLFDSTAGDVAGFEVGARLVLQAMLQSPHFLYRLERLDNLDAVSGKPAPSPYELATRLAYLTWHSAPTAELLDSAQRGELLGDAYPATVQRMLESPNARRGFEGYAQDWLQLYRLDVRTPNEEQGVSPVLLTEMKEETLRFATRIALTENRDLTALFTDKKTDLGPELAQVYGLQAAGQGFTSYDLASDPNRVGILTQPGFMILRAAPERATIVHRGLMVLRIFLCSEVPAPPADAATNIESVPTNLTDRDRFAMHAGTPTCKACHSTFDPLGHPFEPYDLAGRFRTQDQFGNVLRSDGEARLDDMLQTYASTAEFANLLAKSPSVQRCMVRKVFQYGLGRTLRGDDEIAIDDLAQRFEAAGRTYVAALTSVAQSSAFRAVAPNE